MVKRMVTAVVTVLMGVGLGVLLAFAGHSGTAVAAPANQPPSSAESPIASEIAPPPAPESAVAQGYYIKEYKGRVSVLRSGSEVPEMIFDISTKMLPELDRQQLSQGIYVETYEELVRLVEDYIS